MKPDHERPPLIIRPGVSRRLLHIVLLLHGLTLPVVLALPVAWPWRTLLVAALLVGLAGSLGGAVGHRWSWVPRQAIWHPEGHWTLTLGDGREVPARLLTTTFVSPALVVLNFRLADWPGWRDRPDQPDRPHQPDRSDQPDRPDWPSFRGRAAWRWARALLAVSLPGSTPSLVLLPDNLDPDLHRRLRVRLRQEGARPAPGGEGEGEGEGEGGRQ
jgi:toxin CptA